MSCESIGTTAKPRRHIDDHSALLEKRLQGLNHQQLSDDVDVEGVGQVLSRDGRRIIITIADACLPPPGQSESSKDQRQVVHELYQRC